MRRDFAFLGVSLLLLAGAVGCFSFEREYPEKRFYTLDVRRPDTPPLETRPVALKIRRFQSGSALGGKEILYRTSDQTVESDFYHVFFHEPAAMITEEMREWLQDSGLFAHVLTGGSIVEGDYVLEGRVSAVYGDYRGQEPRAVMRLQLFLLRAGEEESAILLQRDYDQSVGLPDATPPALVAGLNRVLAGILAAFESDLADTR